MVILIYSKLSYTIKKILRVFKSYVLEVHVNITYHISFFSRSGNGILIDF